MPSAKNAPSNPSSPSEEVIFLVPGLRTLDPSTNTETVTLSPASRSAGGQGPELHRLSATPGHDTVALSLQDGTGRTLRLVLHPDNARALLLSQGSGQRAGADALAADGAVRVPHAARWNAPKADANASRGWASDLVFLALEIIGISPKRPWLTPARQRSAAGWMGRSLRASMR
jgi:hypothetical protein